MVLKMGKDDKETLAKILVFIGALVGIYAAVMQMVGFNMNTILFAILILVLSIAALFSAIKPGEPIPLNIVVELIIGILILVLGGLSLGTHLIAAILIILGGILLAID